MCLLNKQSLPGKMACISAYRCIWHPFVIDGLENKRKYSWPEYSRVGFQTKNVMVIFVVSCKSINLFTNLASHSVRQNADKRSYLLYNIFQTSKYTKKNIGEYPCSLSFSGYSSFFKTRSTPVCQFFKTSR